MVDVNLLGPINVLESFVPEMIEAGRGGHVVNVSSAAGLFGYADALRLRQEVAVHGLLLLAGAALIAVALWSLYRRSAVKAAVLGLVGVGFLIWWATTETVPREFVFFTPYVVTLIVLAFAAQHLRPPAATGRPYRRRQAH